MNDVGFRERVTGGERGRGDGEKEAEEVGATSLVSERWYSFNSFECFLSAHRSPGRCAHKICGWIVYLVFAFFIVHI